MKAKNIKEATDAIFLPKTNDSQGAYIVYYSPYANDCKGSFNVLNVGHEDILRMHAEANGDEDSFLTLMLDCDCFTHEAGTAEFEKCAESYHTADFIVGRDGNEHDEMVFLVKWALKKKGLNPGDTVWVVVRDEDGAPIDVSEQVFLAQLKNVAMTTMNLGWGIDTIIETLLESTRFNADTDIKAYPSSDCYLTVKDASEALENELRKIRDENFVDLEDDEIKI